MNSISPCHPTQIEISVASWMHMRMHHSRKATEIKTPIDSLDRTDSLSAFSSGCILNPNPVQKRDVYRPLTLFYLRAFFRSECIIQDIYSIGTALAVFGAHNSLGFRILHSYILSDLDFTVGGLCLLHPLSFIHCFLSQVSSFKRVCLQIFLCGWDCLA